MKRFVYILFLMPIFLTLLFGFSYQFTKADMPEEIGQKNAFRIVKKTNENGEIVLSYIFPVNSEYFSQNFNEKQISTYKFYLASYVGALAKSYKQKQTEGVRISSCEYYTDIDGLGFSIYFCNLKSQMQFFNIDSEEDESQKNNKNLNTEGVFIKKTHLKTTFPISSTKSAGDLKMVCVLAISSWCKDCEIENEKKKEEILKILSKANYIYDFATTQNTLQSDLMYDDAKYHHNVFVKSVGEIENDNSIDFWVSSVDKGLCYIFAIILVCSGVIISLIIIKVRKKT